jgi:hypothetical protein
MSNYFNDIFWVVAHDRFEPFRFRYKMIFVIIRIGA